jgi:hypothetical protein
MVLTTDASASRTRRLPSATPVQCAMPAETWCWRRRRKHDGTTATPVSAGPGIARASRPAPAGPHPRRAVLTTDASNIAVAAILTRLVATRRRGAPARGGARKPQADGGGAELSCTCPPTDGGRTRTARVPALSAGWQIVPEPAQFAAGGLLVRLRPADGQPGHHVAQDEPASRGISAYRQAAATMGGHGEAPSP